jgi:TrmH family RNA methyltransferase
MLKGYTKGLDISYSIGVYPTLELVVNRPEEVKKVLLDDRGTKNAGLAKIVDYCKQKGIALETNPKLVRRLAGSENAYCVGVFSKYQCSLEQSRNHVVLVNPSDMGNLGTSIRTMLAFDVVNLALIMPACDIFDPKVLRSSMGALFSINFAYFATFSDYQNRFNNNIYTLRTNADTNINDCKFEKPFSLVFGTESAGLSAEFNTIGRGVKIPHTQQVDSLNLAISVGITLQHAYVQQKDLTE